MNQDFHYQVQMKSDLDIARYNTSKKLSQLNKVIQYLTYHLEDRIYQVLYLKQKYEAQEMEIVNGIDDKIRPIFEKLNESKIEIEEQTNKFYQNKLSTMKAALDARLKTAISDIQSKMNEVDQEVRKSLTSIEIINTTLEEQISILKDKSKFDISSNKIRVNQIGKDHQLEMKKFNGESKRKIKSIEEEFQKKAEALELKYKNEIEQLKKKSDEQVITLPPDFKQTYLNSKERIKTLKNLIYDDLTDVNKQKRIYQQCINSFKERLKKIFDEFPKEIVLDTEEIRKVKDENEGQYYKMKKRINDLRSDFNLRKKNYENDIKLLENQIQNKRGNLSKEHQEKEKHVQLTSKRSNNELFTFIQSLNEEKSKLKAKCEKEEKQIEQNIQKIQMSIENFDEDHSNEFVTLNEQRKSHVDEYKEEVENSKINFENKVFNSVKKFNELKEKYLEKIKHLSSESIEYSKRDDECKKLKIMLETIKRSNESKMKFLLNSTNDEISKFENEKKKEFNDFQTKLNMNFEVAEHKKEADINDYQSEIDIEYNRKKIEFETNYKKEIDRINSENLNKNDQELNDLNSEYEKKFNSMENELNSINIPQEIIELTDQSIHDLQNKLEKLPNEVIEERNSINKQFEQSIEIEEDRHRQLLLQYLAYCNQTQERDYESFQKDQKERIILLGKTINELNAELKSVEQISVSLKNFDDLKDLEQIKLEEELSNVRQEMKAKIRKEEAIKQEMIKEAQEKIYQQEEENKNRLKEEKDKEKIDSNEIHKLFELYRTKRKKLSGNSSQILIDEENNFKNELSKIKSDHSNHLIELKRLIINERHRKEDNEELFEEKLLKEKRRLEKENKKLAEKFPKQIKLLKDGIAGRYPELDELINKATKRRDDAKAAVVNKPMRKEESNIIKRLEGQLSITTSQLTSCGRELFTYRQQLINQEGEYNVRFGVDRSVAVMKPAKRRPTTTMASKRLPKLCNDYSQSLY